MEVAVELEDDLFFADLSKQISLLIMEDDEDSVAVGSIFYIASSEKSTCQTRL